MDGKNGDRRVRRTKNQLRAALTELLGEKSAEEITVTELTGRADVNRGTFYCHYKDIYDMMEQLEEELFQEFAALMDAYTATELRHGLGPILQDVFRFIQRNLDLAIPLLGMRQRTAFLERFKEVVREKVSREWNSLYQFKSGHQREYYLSFLVGGVIGLVQGWAEGGGRETPEEMAAMAEELILRGIEPLGMT